MTDISGDLGLDAEILRMTENTSMPPWLNLNVRQSTLSTTKDQIRDDDLLIVPDILAADLTVQKLKGVKVVYIQGSVMIPLGLKSYKNYQALGFGHSITTMPHITEVLENFWPISSTIISPFISDYFFASQKMAGILERKKQILLFPKPDYKEAGYFDYGITLSVLHQKLKIINEMHSARDSNWSVVELKDRSHSEVARLMQESLFFVNTNCFEAFNATVPEAMAAGCINFCYEAFGGQDFLIDEENAFVFPNNYIYPLLNKLLIVIKDLEGHLEKLKQIQNQGLDTAQKFTKSRTKGELKIFYEKLGIIT
jgi:hypothetical protein